MSGHNKWSKIARKKGVNDQKRGKIFSKIIKEITVASKIGGADPSANARLRTALVNARVSNMPKDVIDRAVKKGAGGGADTNFDEVMYEGYGVGGTAIIVKCLTDNKTRTVGEVRHILTRYGGNMGATGSVSFQFDKKGIIEINKKDATEDKLMEIALEAGADDVTDEGDTFDVVTTPDKFDAVRTAIEQASIPVLSAEVTMIPQNTVSLNAEKAESVIKLLEALEDIDDVQNVYSNYDFAEVK